MVSLILAAVGVATSIASAAVQGSKANKQSNMIDKQINELNDWYTRNRSEDLLDSSSVKNSVREFQNIEQSNNKELSNQISSGGLTAEQQVATASANNQAWGNTIAEIAAKDSEHKQNIEDEYINRSNQLYNNSSNVNKGITTSINNSINGIYDTIDGAYDTIIKFQNSNKSSTKSSTK